LTLEMPGFPHESDAAGPAALANAAAGNPMFTMTACGGVRRGAGNFALSTRLSRL